MFDKLLKPNGWSSKKFAGLVLIISAILMGFLAILIGSIIIADTIVLITLLLTSGLTALGIDAYNKKTKSNQNV